MVAVACCWWWCRSWWWWSAPPLERGVRGAPYEDEFIIITGLEVTVRTGLRARGARAEGAGLDGRELPRPVLGGVAIALRRLGVLATLRTGVEKRLELIEKALDMLE